MKPWRTPGLRHEPEPEVPIGAPSGRHSPPAEPIAELVERCERPRCPRPAQVQVTALHEHAGTIARRRLCEACARDAWAALETELARA